MQTADRESNRDYAGFLESHPRCHFMQSPEWAAVKSNWRNELVVVRDGSGAIKGAMSILIRKVPFFKYSMMYSPRGPVCDLHDGATLSLLVQGAKEIAKKHKGYVLKLDTDTCSDDVRYAQLIKDLGFRIKGGSKNFEGIQPRFVFRLDIAGKTEEEMLASFQQKVRYNIRLAEKKGVSASIGDIGDLAEFHRVMLETGIRDNFVTRDAGYFKKMLECLGPEHARLYLARYDGRIIAGTIAALYGNKCWYLYGASSNEYRNVMPNYLLQWEMIKWALACKCEIYDFRGVSGDLDESNPLYGLYKFKKGFNGQFTEFIGELDYVMNPFVYFAVEKGEKIFRELRRKLFVLKGRSPGAAVGKMAGNENM